MPAVGVAGWLPVVAPPRTRWPVCDPEAPGVHRARGVSHRGAGEAGSAESTVAARPSGRRRGPGKARMRTRVSCVLHAGEAAVGWGPAGAHGARSASGGVFKRLGRARPGPGTSAWGNHVCACHRVRPSLWGDTDKGGPPSPNPRSPARCPDQPAVAAPNARAAREEVPGGPFPALVRARGRRGGRESARLLHSLVPDIGIPCFSAPRPLRGPGREAWHSKRKVIRASRFSREPGKL